MADKPETDAGVPRPVRGLSLVSLCNDFASEMVYPLLPALVTGPLGGGALALGVLDGAADLAAAVLRWWSGRVADRSGWRRPLILVGYSLATILRPVIAVASAAWQVVGLRVLDRVGKGIRSPARDALIADVTPPARRGRSFGLHRAADHFGAVLGSVAAAALLASGAGLRGVIAASVVPGLLALALLVWVLRGLPRAEPSAPPVPAGAPESPAPLAPIAMLAALTAARLPETLLLLRLQDLGFALALVPLLWGGMHVLRSAAAYPAGRLADRVGARLTLAAGSLGYAACLAAFAGAATTGSAVAAFLAIGIAGGVLEPAERVLVASTGASRQGRAFGTYQSLAGVGGLAVALALGWTYQRLGGETALLAGAGLVGALLPIWLLFGSGFGPTGGSRSLAGIIRGR